MLSSDVSRMKRIVLVGGGHAHVQVIKALNRYSRPKEIHVTLIDLQSAATYSGMLPGCIAKLYSMEQTQIQLAPLAEWAGIDFFQGEVVDVDPVVKKVVCKAKDGGVHEVCFDVISMDIGSTCRGLGEKDGEVGDQSWRKHVIPTRPVSDLAKRIADAEQLLQTSTKSPPEINVVVVGGGAAGIELAFAMRARWVKYAPDITVTILDAGAELLPNENFNCRATLKQAMSDSHIKVLPTSVVKRVTPKQLVLQDGQTIPFTHCLWATGAAAHPLASQALRKRGIAISDQGWIRVSPSLQSLSHDCIFAAGDCATIELPSGQASPPKAGVYAVRAGPILIQNLVAYLCGGPLVSFTPQEDFLRLLMCGDGTAIGFRFGIAMRGKWVWYLKDQIDQNFMSLFAKENLPVLEEGALYDTSQYDASDENEVVRRIDPQEAA